MKKIVIWVQNNYLQNIKITLQPLSATGAQIFQICAMVFKFYKFNPECFCFSAQGFIMPTGPLLS